MRQSLLAALVVTCIVLSAACDNSGGSTTSPSLVPLTSEPFSGTVQPMGSDSHTFTVAQQGEIDVTLTSAGPPPTIFMGLAIGTPSTTDGSCVPLSGASTQTQASATAQLSGTAAAGSFCVVVFDVGNQTAAVTYTVVVAHS